MISQNIMVYLQYIMVPVSVIAFLFWSLCNKVDVYKALFATTIATIIACMRDAYLARHQIRSYPQQTVSRPAILGLSCEVIVFSALQNCDTVLIYLLISKTVFQPIYLRGRYSSDSEKDFRSRKWLGLALPAMLAIFGAKMLFGTEEEGFYIGVVLCFNTSVLLWLWTSTYQFMRGIPLSMTISPVVAAVSHAWIVDMVAVHKGTWRSDLPTGSGRHLPIDLALASLFLALSNNFITVLGLVAFDKALAVVYTFPSLFPSLPTSLTPILLYKALQLPATAYDTERLWGLAECVTRLQKKSHSFYLASFFFSGRLQVDLVILYAFCRVADDLVDSQTDPAIGKHWVAQLKRYLDLQYRAQGPPSHDHLSHFVSTNFPSSAHAPLLLLPTAYLPREPLYELLEGFQTDLRFADDRFPIHDEEDLRTYAHRVAGTVGNAFTGLVYYHYAPEERSDQRFHTVEASARMGEALQYVNIARDTLIDARMRRVYIPTVWLKELDLVPEDILKLPHNNETAIKLESLRQRLLDKAFEIYEGARGDIDHLPGSVGNATRVAVESYMEIGRVLRRPGRYQIRRGKATVPRWRRLKVAFMKVHAR